MHPSSSRESPAGTLPWLPGLPCPHLPAGEPGQRVCGKGMGVQRSWCSPRTC
ncbi:hypothetical protein Nmel_015366 [Mimus melanotis]